MDSQKTVRLYEAQHRLCLDKADVLQVCFTNGSKYSRKEQVKFVETAFKKFQVI